MSVSITQLLMIALFVRKKRTCAAGWTNAGFTRRAATKMWGAAFLLQAGSMVAQDGGVGIVSADMFPQGMEALQEADVARLHGQIAEWFDYWSGRHPSDTIHQAMINLLRRLLKVKKEWVAERTGQFPFELAMQEVRVERFEALMEGAKA